MGVKECYEQLGLKSSDVLGRLGSEAIVKKFAIKFLDDKSFEELTKYLEEGNAEEAFRAAHTLKGICLNLAFNNLFEPANSLTESLRGGAITDESKALYQDTKAEYEKVVAAVTALRDEKGV